MPNWSTSEVTIRGDVSDLEDILSRCSSDGKPFSFENFVPTPAGLNGEVSFSDLVDALQENCDTFEFKDWYSWRIAFWGTKWDLDDSTIIDDSLIHNGVLKVEYNSAWSPPVSFWKNFSKLYPNVTIVEQYYELGAGFIGEAVIHNGLVNDRCEDITDEIMSRAGAIFDEEGYVDWEISEVDFSSVFPLADSS